MNNNNIIIHAKTPRELVAVHDFLSSLEMQDGIEIRNITSKTRGLEEIIIKIIGSAALIILAKAIRDLTQKKKIHISMRWNDGSQMDIHEEGKDINGEEIVGYITKGFQKNVSEIVSKNVDEHSFEVRLKIDNEENC